MRRILVFAASLVLPAPLLSQSLVYRSPNLGGTWVADGGVVQFNFLHRFYVSPGPARTVSNFPTFTVAAGVGGHAMVGWHFATKGINVAGATSTNETELFARWRVLGGPEGAPGFTLALTPAYNLHAKSFDAEVGAAYTAGRLTVNGAVRELTKPFGAAGAQAAVAGGANLRLNNYVSLSGDYAKLLGGDSTAAWSAALSFVIPGSPHTFSLQVSNVASNTIQGSSQGFLFGPVKRFYGFEFTIPLHLNRFAPWFKKGTAAAGAMPAEAGVTEIRITGFKFADTTTVAVGETVRWVNADQVSHTITFEGAEDIPNSQPIPTGSAFTATFARAGTYTYHCTPHPFMRGTIVVR